MFENDTFVTAKIRQSAIGGLCTCLHANMSGMESDEVRADWPFGPALKRLREEAALSQREASRRTAPPGGKPTVSAGRWKQLETGWQKNKGVLIPIGTTPATVAAVARVVNWDIADALQLAGFSADDAPRAPTEAPITNYTDDELLAEIRRRMKGAHHRDLETAQESPASSEASSHEKTDAEDRSADNSQSRTAFDDLDAATDGAIPELDVDGVDDDGQQFG